MQRNVTRIGMLIVLMLAVGCSGASPADRWFAARANLTAAQDTALIAHQAGWIDDVTLVHTIDPAAQTGRRYLDESFKLLPDGGSAFDHWMLLLDAVIAELTRLSAPPG